MEFKVGDRVLYKNLLSVTLISDNGDFVMNGDWYQGIVTRVLDEPYPFTVSEKSIKVYEVEDDKGLTVTISRNYGYRIRKASKWTCRRYEKRQEI